MKITIVEKDRSVTVEHIQNDMTVGQVVENLFRPAMLGMGYAEKSLDDSIGGIDCENIILDDEEN